MRKCKMLEIGDVKAKAVLFHISTTTVPKHSYVVEAEESDYVAFHEAYCVGDKDAKRAQGINLDGMEKCFYLCYVAGCYDPPVAIVRADNRTEAEERFASETPYALIDEADLKDYEDGPRSENLCYNDHGKPYDNEGIQVREVQMSEIVL